MTVAEAVTLLAATGAFLVAAAGAFVSVWNAVHIQQVHVMVNSQAAKFEALAKMAGFAEGARSDIRVARSEPSVEFGGHNVG